MNNYLKRIEIDPNKMLGKPVIKGTRIPVYVVLKLISEGLTYDEIIHQYPDLTKEDIKAAVLYASSVLNFEEKLLYKKKG